MKRWVSSLHRYKFWESRLRAIALFGILLVNIKFFSTPALQAEVTNISYANTISDQISQWVIFIFAEVKFISMFSMLFGIGFLLFMERGEKRGMNIKRLFKRRLLILLCFGVIHLLFFWYGDILTIYAILGFILLLTKAKKPKFLLKATFISISIPIAFMLLFALLLSNVEPSTTSEQQLLMENEVNRVVDIYSNGTYSEIFLQRINDIITIWVGNIFLVGNILAMFFFGMYLWKTGIFTHTTENIEPVKKIAITSLIIAIPSLVLAISGKLFLDGENSPWYFLQYAGLLSSGPALSVFYVMSLLLLLENKQIRAKLAQFLQPVGKMALSNYLFQTLLCTMIFYSYGLGLFGKIGPFYGVLLTLGIYTTQMVLSYYWMNKFQFGPIEWLWRRLTYGKSAMNNPMLEKAK